MINVSGLNKHKSLFSFFKKEKHKRLFFYQIFQNCQNKLIYELINTKKKGCKCLHVLAN